MEAVEEFLDKQDKAQASSLCAMANIGWYGVRTSVNERMAHLLQRVRPFKTDLMGCFLSPPVMDIINEKGSNFHATCCTVTDDLTGEYDSDRLQVRVLAPPARRVAGFWSVLHGIAWP